MKEHPILFTGEMVKAILAGRKTQTRRVVKPQPPSIEAVQRRSGTGYSWLPPDHHNPLWRVAGPVWAVRDLMTPKRPHLRCPYGVTGDRLWVRETWAPQPEREDAWNLPEYEGGGGSASDVCYRADERPNDDPRGGLTHGVKRWRPAIHMPRFASRITLEVTAVRVERIQDISERDACSEVGGNPMLRWCYRPKFQALWDSINGKRSAWSSNPWCWVVCFKRAEVA